MEQLNMFDNTECITDVPLKKERKKRAPKKPISELNEMIKLELKKERIFSKTEIIDKDSNDYYQLVINSINDIINKSNVNNKISIYIMDQLYFNNNIRYLIDAPDTYSIITNNDELYNRLKDYNFQCYDYALLYYFDGINGLIKYKGMIDE